MEPHRSGAHTALILHRTAGSQAYTGAMILDSGLCCARPLTTKVTTQLVIAQQVASVWRWVPSVLLLLRWAVMTSRASIDRDCRIFVDLKGTRLLPTRTTAPPWLHCPLNLWPSTPSGPSPRTTLSLAASPSCVLFQTPGAPNSTALTSSSPPTFSAFSQQVNPLNACVGSLLRPMISRVCRTACIDTQQVDSNRRGGYTNSDPVNEHQR